MRNKIFNSFKNKAASIISNNRRKSVLVFLYKLARWFINSYENYNYNISTNGEEMVIGQMKLNNDAVVFDVRFNKGEWSKIVLKHYSEINIYSFEPQADLVSKVKKDFSSYKNVKLFDFGLSDITKTDEIYIYENHDFLSGIYNHPHDIANVKKEVNFRDGSEVFFELGLQKIDFLKIDVEGAEHLVLKGFEEVLKLGKISAIQFEYGKGSINSKFLLKDYYEYLEPMGYKIGKIYPNYIDFKSYNWNDENFIGANYLAVLNASNV